jgi:hypothetical protein
MHASDAGASDSNVKQPAPPSLRAKIEQGGKRPLAKDIQKAFRDLRAEA